MGQGYIKKTLPYQKLFRFLMIYSLLYGLLPAGDIWAMSAINKLQPLLSQLAVEEPLLPVDVIIQQVRQTEDIAARIVELGGTIRRSLPLINALAVTLPAQALPTVAQLSTVRSISLDGQLYKSNTLADEDHVTLREEFNDEFVAPAASDWSGLGTWSGQPWQELGESDGSASGDVVVTNFFGGTLHGLRLQNSQRGLVGVVPLTKATAATLTYAYRRKDFDDAADYVTVALSTDNGLSWTTLEQLSGPATDNKIEVTQLDLTPYVVAGVEGLTVRFLTSTAFDATDKFYVDFVQVEYAPIAEPELPTSAGANRAFLPLASRSNETVATTPASEPSVLAAESANMRNVTDCFDTNGFGGNLGWENWSTNWIESDSAWGGAGPTAGRVQVTGGALRLDNYGSSFSKPSAARGVNLGGGVNAAILDFGFFTSAGVDASDAVAVEVSKDGGASYTTLETFTNITGETYWSRDYDVTRFATPNFRVRFRVGAGYSGSGESFNLDCITVYYSRIDSGSATALLLPAWQNGWRYLDNGSNQGTAWRQPGFDDSSWPIGRSELGYGDYDEGGSINYGSDPNNKPITVYFRRSFHVADLSPLDDIRLGLLRDDGAVVYINGVEFVRDNMPSGTITYQTRASRDISLRSEETTFVWYTVPASLLKNGENVIAVEVHQSAPNSDDLSFNLEVGAWSTCIDCINTTILSGAYAQSIRATNLWNGTPRLQGQGVTIAVIDSGIAPHYDSQNGLMSDRVLKRVNFVSAATSVDDTNGHGSHIAGIIAGNGAKSGGAYVGIAPNANLVDVRVTDDQGRGSMSDVVAGIQWVYDNRNTYNIRVANLSLNSTVAESYHVSPLNAALEILWFNGVTVVVSAGNNGGTTNGVLYPPANDPFVITVGAADDRGTTAITDDLMPTFSAYGTTSDGFAKPDLVAPGRNIISLLASDDSNLVLNHPANEVAAASGTPYFRMSGTSMASAVAAGAVALLLQDEPNLTPDQVKYRLKATANKNWSGYTSQKAGAGYLDINTAVNGTTTQSANTGVAASQLLWTGTQPVVWGSVSWNSVSWNSVSWNSVSWNSVSWNSVSWNSVSWE
jgi:serine protease AprX